MDFGKILDDWESGKIDKKNKRPVKAEQKKSSDLKELIKQYDVFDKDVVLDREKPVVPGEGRQKLKRMPHELTLDLHGCTVEEGLAELEVFIRRAQRGKMKKILIIHGKGKHSPRGPVLRDAVRKYLQESSMIGETGKPKRNDGGDGATWAIIRYRSR